MALLNGQNIGRYHIIEQLGEGGMASVYKAYDTRLERDVAVKVIRMEAFPPDQVDQILKRFEREAKALAKLSHFHIIKVIDFGENEGAPYLIMEFMPGGTLKQKMGKPVPWSESASLLLPIAQALGYAHRHGIIHRDVKPSNILITESGQPMLTDFGIAKLLEPGDSKTLTGTGVGIGTPEYMAPEQSMGHAVDGRADIYSLGIVFYELITGRKPYVADTPMAVVFKHLTDPLPRPNLYVKDLPEAVEKVLFKALAKSPEDRYADMEAFANALEKLSGNSQPASMDQPSENTDQELPVDVPTNLGLEPQKTLTDVSALEPVETGASRTSTLVMPEEPPQAEPKPVRKSFRSTLEEYYGRSLQTLQGLSSGQKIAALAGLLVLILLAAALAFSPAILAGTGISSTQVFFSSDRLGSIEVFGLTLGETPQRITSTPPVHQSWSPAPTFSGYTYFASDRSGKTEIWRANAGMMRQITNSPGNSNSWGPRLTSSNYLYFSSDRNDLGKSEVYCLDTQGKPVNLSNSPFEQTSWTVMGDDRLPKP